MFRVLVSDKLSDEGLALLKAEEEIEVEHRPGIDPDELRRIIPDCDALIVRSGTKVTADLLEAADKLRVIGRAGIGVDNVDLRAATARGVLVMNSPEGNAITTAEHAIALMTSLARRVPQATASVRAGKWERSELSGKELFNQVLGIIGLGTIGSIVADRARGLRMQVIAVDPLVSEERGQHLGVGLVSLDELYRRADVISVHVPKTRDNTALLDAEAFAKMKDGVLLVNAARGGIVSESALVEALDSGKVAGAAIDVFESEPPPPDHPLLQRDDVVLTPHLGAATGQAQVNVAIDIATQVRDYLKNGAVRNAVNLPSLSVEELEEIGPFIALGEKLGSFQGQICRDGIEEIDVEYAGQIAEQNVQAVTVAVLKGLLTPWVGDRVNFVNASHIAQEHGVRVIESKAALPEDFVSLLTVRVRTPQREHLISGAIFGRTQPRIVRVDDFRFEAIPEGAMFLVRNIDRPGVVGRLGTLLGDADINIKRMQLGLHPETGKAMQLLSVDPVPSDEVVDAVHRLEGVESAQLLDLGERVS